MIPFTLLLDRQDSSLGSWVSLNHFPHISIRIPLISHSSHTFSPSNLPTPHYLDFSYPVEISNFFVVCYSTRSSYFVLFHFIYYSEHICGHLVTSLPYRKRPGFIPLKTAWKTVKYTYYLGEWLSPSTYLNTRLRKIYLLPS